MSQLKLSLFGSPQATVSGAPVGVASRKALALLFYLAVTDIGHHRDHLATLFWPEQDQRRARAGLRQALWLLKKIGLEPWLAVEQDALRLEPSYWCDVQQFRRQIEMGQLHEALALYRGEFLMGFTLRDCPEFDQWQFLQADELRRQLADVLETLMQQCAEAGDYDTALGYARRWLSLDPLLEEAHRHLMRLYTLAGQQAVALYQYEECVRILDEELGVPPDEETTGLYRAIKTRQFSPSVGDGVKAQEKPNYASQSPQPASVVHNLPMQLTPFVGRETEVAELQTLLNDDAVRLLTVTGPGGIGKTRLAVHLATQLHECGHAVAFVDLQPVQSPALVGSAILDALSLPHGGQADPVTQLAHFFSSREMTLVLDNFEHLLDGVHVLSELLRSATGLKLLVTSRSVLNLQEEWLYAVSGLRNPQAVDSASPNVKTIAEYDAIQFFISCARRVRPDFQIEAEAEGVVRVCQLVEGMPLAIELAAAWAKTLTAEAIASEIASDLTFLATPLRNMPPKHRNIQVVFQRSWQLLTLDEQEVYRRLSVFRGGFDRDAAHTIAGASLPMLTSLVDKSLLRWQGNGRYTIHELLRQCAQEQLVQVADDLVATRDRHSSYYATFLGKQPGNLTTAAQETIARIKVDLDNIRAAWQWAVERAHLADIQQAAMSLFVYCQVQSRYREGLEAFTSAIESISRLPDSEQRDRVQATLLTVWGLLAMRLGRLEEAGEALTSASELYELAQFSPEPVMATDPLAGLTILMATRGDYDQAITLGEQAWQMASVRNDKGNLALIGYGLTGAAIALGRYDDAHRYAVETLALAKAEGTRWFMAYIYNHLGEINQILGDIVAAKKYYQASYALREEYEDPEGMAVALTHLGDIALLEDDYWTAQTLYQQSLAIYQEIGDQGGLVRALDGLGLAAHRLGHFSSARQYLQRALQLAVDTQITPFILAVLVDIGIVLVETGSQGSAMKALFFVQRHPACDQGTKDRVNQILAAHYEKQPITGEPQVQTDERVSLAALVEDLIIELTAPEVETPDPDR